ncbi:DUF6891 domain-containing protein [Actinomadura macrotermitis]|uniref:DUF6891 domain-containing protein n=1 Tax=Actinomadura macrotermitis TaxID=2585200 RepID=A0A7K0BPX6_9ACTN|nr:hypothetical protein [Actinomadura macrotermitis]MQY02932.1 hypothetical protein [Actinomadura macrotermitis]
MTEEEAELREQLEENVRSALARGESDIDQIVEEAVEYFDDEELSENLVREVAAAGLASYRVEQRGWTGMLDAERLLAAFRDLDAAGIVARADFTCCQTCGFTEIGAERPAGEEPRGFVFCHGQDVDGAIEGHGVYLAFGTFQEDGDVVAIAEQVIVALHRRGLAAKWYGNVNKRIHVPLTWRRRLPAAEAEGAPLRVRHYDRTRNTPDEDLPMDFETCRGLLYDLVPADGNFIVCESRSGAVVQGAWESGPARFWMETLDQEAECSYGRHVTLDEAAEVIRVLAEEDRVTLADLGELETVAWPAAPIP